MLLLKKYFKDKNLLFGNKYLFFLKCWYFDQVNPPTSSTPPTTYNLGHYPQFYPAQHATAQQSSSASAGPSAPPQTTPTDKNNPHLYPTLPVNQYNSFICTSKYYELALKNFYVFAQNRQKIYNF